MKKPSSSSPTPHPPAAPGAGSPPPAFPAIAIVGMAGLFPQAKNLNEFWRLIRRGEDGIKEVPASHWRIEDYYDPKAKTSDRVDRTYCRKGGFLEPVEFDPTEFGIPPTVLEATDTSQLLGLVVGKAALDDAGYGATGREFDRKRASVILGVTGTLELVVPLGARLGHPIWRRALEQAGVDRERADAVIEQILGDYVAWQENSFPGLLGNVVAGRIANRLNLRGTNCVVDAACASSLSAMHLAALELAAGRSDMVLTGGVDTFNDIFMYMCFTKTQALSAGGDARPFSADADGTVLGEGIGMVVMKRLADAERDGDRIYAVLRGLGTSSDGRSQSIYAPRSEGQAEALRAAYSISGVRPSDIELVEAHGTGTKVGDAVEFEALKMVYGEAAEPGAAPWVTIGSVKSQIGHTKAAAGAASLIKAVLALHHKVLPPTLKVREPNPKMELGASPFVYRTEPAPWIAPRGGRRRAAVSSFGFGGSNFHAVVEEYGDGAKRETAWDGSVQIFAFAGDTPDALKSDVEMLFAGAAATDEAALARAAWESRQTFAAGKPWRLVLVRERGQATTTVLGAARDAVSKAASGSGAGATRVTNANRIAFVGGPNRSAPEQVAFLFPGQGSQSVGMLRDGFVVFPEMFAALEAVAEDAAGARRKGERGPNESPAEAMFPPARWEPEKARADEERLRRPDLVQPALCAASLGVLNTLRSFGVDATYFAGHSFGELLALHAAGAFDAAALVRLSRVRGALMAAAAANQSAPGGMTALAVSAERAAALLKEAGGAVTLANQNAPDQTVVSGPIPELEKLEGLCEQRGVAARRIPVGAAFHSPAMTGAAREFASVLGAEQLAAPSRRVLANQSADFYPAGDALATARLLAAQITDSVRFTEGIQKLFANGARTFVEVGPKSVLSGLVKKILAGQAAEIDVIACDGGGGKEPFLLEFARSLAQLAALGLPVALSKWERQPEPARKPGMIVPLLGINYRSNPPAKPALPAKPAPAPAPAAAPKATPVSVAPGAAAPAPSTFKAVSVSTSPQAGPMSNVPLDSSRPTPPVGGAPSPNPAAAPANAESLHAVLATVQEGLRAIQSLQQQTAAAHERFLAGQELAQRTFLQVLQGQQELVGRLTTGGVPGSAAVSLPAPSVAPVVLQPVAAVSSAPVAVAPAPATAPAAPTQVVVARPVVMEPPAPAPAPAPAAAVAVSGVASEVSDTLLAVVSELTGYPREMLELEMDLEADLGIDSIKRVEILANLQKRMPSLPAVPSSYVGSLRTLKQVVEAMAGVSATTAPAPAPAAASPAAATKPGGSAPVAPAAAPAPGRDLAALLIEVVSELTGYPKEMVELGMDLEADLGIDSIKRVEILAAVQKRAPELPPVPSSYLGSLRTLEQIVNHLASQGGATGTTSASAAAAAAPSAPAPVARTSAAARPAVQVQVQALAFEVASGAGPEASARVLAEPEAGVILVQRTTDGFSRAVAETLRARGYTVREVPPGVTTAEPEAIAAFILLSEVSGGAASDSRLTDTFLLLKTHADALRGSARAGAPSPLLAGVVRLDGSFGLADGAAGNPFEGGLAGLVKTAGREWPEVATRVIDMAASGWAGATDAATRLVDELCAGGPAETGLSPSRRGALRLQPFALGSDTGAAGATAVAVSASDVILVTGGARGVTAECVIELARRVPARFALLGRSAAPGQDPAWAAGASSAGDLRKAAADGAFAGRRPTPADVDAAVREVAAAREIRDTLARIRATGAKVEYYAVDTRDTAAVRAAAARIAAELGPITGVVHGAGVIADRVIAQKTRDQFEKVYETKVGGLRSVLGALGEAAANLRVLALFSSVSGRFGNPGQCDYAAANEGLNKIARYEAARRGSRCRVVSFLWGPWEGGMVNETLRREFERRGVSLIPLTGGADVFASALTTSAAPPVELVVGGDLFATVDGEGSSASAAAGANGAHGHHESAEPGAGSRKKKGATRANGSGAAAAAEGESLATALEISIRPADHPYLSDHVIGGRPVMPLAMLVEWLGHAAAHANPGLTVRGVRDLRVLKALGFEHGNGEVSVVLGRVKKAAEGALTLAGEVHSRGTNGARESVHLRGVVELAAGGAAAVAGEGPGAALLESLAGEPYAAAAFAGVYRDILFHGPALQAIQAIDGLGQSGVVARVSASPEVEEWVRPAHRSGWIAEPLGLDAILQLGIVWTQEQLGVRSLPMSAREVQWGSGLAIARKREGAFRAVLRIVEAEPHRLLADAWLVASKSGEVVLAARGIEWIADASLASSFGKGAGAAAKGR